MNAALRHLSPWLLARRGLTQGLMPGLLLGLAACAQPAAPEIARDTEALIGGTFDQEDPAVVALTRGGDSSFCTGSLISPGVILTAAHCIDMLGADPNAAVYFGSDVSAGGGQVTVGQKKQHPMWNGDVGAYDVGMLLMDFPKEDITPLLMNRSSPASDHVGADYRHVGFGVFDRNTGSADGKKRTGTTTISSVAGDIIRSGDSSVSVCFGDSGGPAFLTVEGEEKIAGIHSFTTGQECNPPNGDTDVQQYADDFILPWVQDNDPSCGLNGFCSTIGCTDDPDCEPCGPDGTCVSDCELPDLDCTTQELGEICKADSQCTTGICAAYRASREYSFCTEECDAGNDSCPKGMSCQNILPFGDICYYDEDPAGVIGDTCSDHAECGSYKCSADGFCVIECDLSIGRGCPDSFSCETHDEGENYFCYADPTEESGCNLAGSRSAAGLWLVLLALFGLRRRRLAPAAATRSLLS